MHLYLLGNGTGFFSEKINGRLIHFCMICKYHSMYVTHVKRHVLIHTGEKPYSCELCDYQSKQKESLKIHVLKHFMK